MSYYINNSSRRFPQPPDEEMEKSWEESLGKPKGAVCNACGQKSDDGEIVNGLCRICRSEPPEITIEEAMSDLDESMNASEERDLNAESSGSYQNDY